MENLLKKYWWLLLIFVLGIPLFLNFLIQLPSFFSVVGDELTWLNFWVTYISAIASFAMVIITWMTLKQNREELEEIKKQWREQNVPKVTCSLESVEGGIQLFLFNSSRVMARDVRVTIQEDFSGAENVFNEVEKLEAFFKIRDSLKETVFNIAPSNKKIIPLRLSERLEENYKKLFLDVTISIKDQGDMSYRFCLEEVVLVRTNRDDSFYIERALNRIENVIRLKKYGVK